LLLFIPSTHIAISSLAVRGVEDHRYKLFAAFLRGELRRTSLSIAPSSIGDTMYLLFIPSLFAVVVIGFIQLRDQFALTKSKQSDISDL
jgi:hypothetical protein